MVERSEGMPTEYDLDDKTLVSEAARHEKVSNTPSEPQNAEDQVTQYSEDTFPNVHEPVGKKQKKQHQTKKLKRASKATITKKVQFKHVEFEEPVIANAELSIIRTKSWTRLLRHRMASGGFLNLMEMLDYEQWSAIMETRFGGILAVRTRLIPKRLAR
ncbi:hypothetical protein Cgig2_024229 [Carnegiea gigantea]|uniref:Uncharacterized protein n=1 Tax=Carnegiea gigantea TaxID=171969 RepID=A0A9Q1JZ54_9CARY|nr:hypothetical protein Cgig2_024229 [Carnegiea gigantea]